LPIFFTQSKFLLLDEDVGGFDLEESFQLINFLKLLICGALG